MNIRVHDEILQIHSLGLLDSLLIDKTTGVNIIWATDAYSEFGYDYGRDKEIKTELLLKEPFCLMSRAEKSKDTQTKRTKAHAEVFTPMWIVKQMVDMVDSAWFEMDKVFDKEQIIFPDGKDWQQYVDSTRLEITCGEAPFLVSRYDVMTGKSVPIEQRVGLLDRKLRVIDENTTAEEEWLRGAYRAFQAIYGYEFQGDNLLLARLNLLLTFRDYMQVKFNRQPSIDEYQKLIQIIVWNIWQMDGLSGAIPYCDTSKTTEQISLFDSQDNEPMYCKIFDWRENHSIEYIKCGKDG